MEQKRMPIFAERFAQLRREMTQAEFAEFLGISRPTVGFYENGVRLPDALLLCQIAEKCNVSADWLLGTTDVKSRNINLQYLCDYTGLSENALLVLAGWNCISNSKNTSILTVLNNLLSTTTESNDLEEDISFHFNVILERLAILADINMLSSSAITEAEKDELIQQDGLYDYSNDPDTWRDIEEYRAMRSFGKILSILSEHGQF